MKNKIEVGTKVNYHSIVNGPITSSGHIVEAIEPKPNNYGTTVAWITGKSGCVSIKALTKDNSL